MPKERIGYFTVRLRDVLRRDDNRERRGFVFLMQIGLSDLRAQSAGGGFHSRVEEIAQWISRL
jgi:hypothetical protein